MPTAGVVLFPTGSSTRKPRNRAASLLLGEVNAALRALLAGGLCEAIVVIDDPASERGLLKEATVLLDEHDDGACSKLRAVADYSAREGHDALVVTEVSAAAGPSSLRALSFAWEQLATATSPALYLVSRRHHLLGELIRIRQDAFPALPLALDLLSFVAHRPELMEELEVDPERVPLAVPSAEEPEERARRDVEAVTALLGRPPSGGFSVAVRDENGAPVVIKNAPFLDDGTPMPTLYWLVGRAECEAVGRLESKGGVNRAEAVVDPKELEAAHGAYASEREALISADRTGPRPSGGVGGTRVGVKCLHAHLAYYLAGGADPVGRWTAAELSGELSGPVGVLDCGTNSIRLLVVDRRGATAAREMVVTRLGAGVDENHRLGNDAIERTLEVLRHYRGVMDANGVVAFSASATSACRDANNAASFLEAAGSILCGPVAVVSGEEEGRFSYRGATAGFAPESGPFVVLDIGGGSSELCFGEAPGDALAVVSLPLGCVRMTERYLVSDPPRPEEIERARAHVTSVLSEGIAELCRRAGREDLRGATLVGLAGTVASLAVLDAGLDAYDGKALAHHRISKGAVAELTASLLSSPLERQLHRPGLSPGRADVIGAGSLVLEAAMGLLDAPEILYSEADILDGIALKLRAEMAKAN